jgi:hypothetical protein
VYVQAACNRPASVEMCVRMYAIAISGEKCRMYVKRRTKKRTKTPDNFLVTV